MYLIKTAFWLSLIILVLPTSAEDQGDIYGTATQTVRDLKSFCTRNPQVCTKSAEAWTVFKQKAEFGAKLVMDLVNSEGNDQTQSYSATPSAKKTGLWIDMFGARDQNTLTSADREPRWNGPRRPGA